MADDSPWIPANRPTVATDLWNPATEDVVPAVSQGTWGVPIKTH